MSGIKPGTLQSEEDLLYSENVYLIDSKRRIRGVYNGTQIGDIRRLLEDLEVLKKTS